MANKAIIGEVVRTLELAEILSSDDSYEPTKFRLEVLKDLTSSDERYYAQVTRWETYRMTPRFPGEGREVGDVQSDCEMLMLDDEFRGGEFAGNSIDEVVNGIIDYMRSRGYFE